MKPMTLEQLLNWLNDLPKHKLANAEVLVQVGGRLELLAEAKFAESIDGSDPSSIFLIGRKIDA